jgi:hypothetical protein
MAIREEIRRGIWFVRAINHVHSVATAGASSERRCQKIGRDLFSFVLSLVGLPATFLF